MKRAHGAGLQEMKGTWVSGRGRQDSKRREYQWRPEVVDACTGLKVVQEQKRVDNLVQIGVQLSLRVADW